MINDNQGRSHAQSHDSEGPGMMEGDFSSPHFQDNRPEAFQMKRQQFAANNSPQIRQLKALQRMANNSAQVGKTAQLQAMAKTHLPQPIQRKEEAVPKPAENNTGLPDDLKSGMENLSGFSMDDVKVHYNSDKPAQLQAHAYAQGTDIHLGAGQEKHLPHEAWHVVQQKQGRVKPTMQLKGKVNVNDDTGLEHEADVMGAKALQMAKNTGFSADPTSAPGKKTAASSMSAGENSPVQGYWFRNGDGIAWKGDLDYLPSVLISNGLYRKVKGLRKWKYSCMPSFFNKQLPVYELTPKQDAPPPKHGGRRSEYTGGGPVDNYPPPLKDTELRPINELSRPELRSAMAEATRIIRRKPREDSATYASRLLERNLKRKFDFSHGNEDAILAEIRQFVTPVEDLSGSTDTKQSEDEVARPLTGQRVEPESVHGYDRLPADDQARVRERLEAHNTGERRFNFHRGLGNLPTMDIANMGGGGGGGGRGDTRLQFHGDGTARLVGH